MHRKGETLRACEKKVVFHKREGVVSLRTVGGRAKLGTGLRTCGRNGSKASAKQHLKQKGGLLEGEEVRKAFHRPQDHDQWGKD